jgi:uncharacterized protein (DUF4213/DUF364 family)
MEELRNRIKGLIKRYGLRDSVVEVHAQTLSPEEAIGNPEDKDYPLLKGKERLIQAEYSGSLGVAFTDMYGNYRGKLSEIVDMDLKNNFRRAIFISTINAVLRYLGLIEKTGHCKDEGPVNCAYQLPEYIKSNFGNPKIAFVGFQPRLVEALSKSYRVKVTDMDPDNIGKTKFGIKIQPPEDVDKNIAWCNLVFVTGSTFVNDTYEKFLSCSKPVVFYGVTGAGASYLLNLKRYCPFGR